MKSILSPLLGLSWCVLLSSCSILNKNQVDAFALLDRAKGPADTVQQAHAPGNKADYVAAQRLVAELISEKSLEAAAVGGDWLPVTHIDGSLAGYDRKHGYATGHTKQVIDKVILSDAPPAPAGAAPAPSTTPEEFIVKILDAWRANAVEGRQAQAKDFAEKRLESYKWKAW